MDVAELQSLFLFATVSPDDLARLAEMSDEVMYEADEVLFRVGELADFWWVLLEGRVQITRRAGREESLVGVMEMPGLWAGGFRAWSDTGRYVGSARALATTRMLRVPADALRVWAQEVMPFGVHLVNGFYQTVRTVEAISNQRESLLSLGTLAAGLAHELNNPAAAAVRGVAMLHEARDTTFASLAQLAEHSFDAKGFLALDALRDELDGRPAITDAIVLADREDELGRWLEAHDVDAAYRIAPPLAAAGADVAWCEQVAAVLPGATRAPGFAWVGSTVATAALLSEMQEATGRIGMLVQAMRGYSQVDRASVQLIDVTDGIESTLVILDHKLRGGVTVERDYAADLPRIEANAGELNQVWTNIIDNAVDAMDGTGTLCITARAIEGDDDDEDGGGVVVEIHDTGPGMTPEAQRHAFDPFFTTKDVGKGTGLGLDITRRIVVENHHGDIQVESVPGATTFRVRLPRRHRGSA
jgi:signal transduction histidine kinase